MVSDTDLVMIAAISVLAVFLVLIILMKTRKKGKTDKTPPQEAKKEEKPFGFLSFGKGPEKEKVDFKFPADAGKTEVFDRTHMSMDVLILACVMIGFVMFMYGYVDKANGQLAAIIGSTMFLPFGVLIGALFIGSFRVKLLRRMTRRNYGVIKFIHSNRLIKPVIANLDQDIVRFADGIYIIDKHSIKREGEEEPSNHKIEEHKIKFEEGIPTIYYDIGDIMPVDFQGQEKTPETERFRLPTQVSATLNKEIAVEKAKVMKAFKRTQDMMMLAILCLLVLSVYFSYTLYSNSQKNTDTINSVKGSMDSLKSLILPAQAIATTTTILPLPQPIGS
jgi:heme/copper-type cytochrome/quinol oxidase subunit 2